LTTWKPGCWTPGNSSEQRTETQEGKPNPERRGTGSAGPPALPPSGG
jgi:hypothetical protein